MVELEDRVETDDRGRVVNKTGLGCVLPRVVLVGVDMVVVDGPIEVVVELDVGGLEVVVNGPVRQSDRYGQR